MKLALREELKALMHISKGPCVSIFMPTYRSGTETQQNPIRLKNLLGKAQEQLMERGLRTPEAVELLNPGQGLLEDGFFWRDQEDGLALFMAPEFSRIYRLPVPFEETAFVLDYFLINPIFPLLQGDGRFYVLAISQGQIRLLDCSRYGYKEVSLAGVPKSIDEALKFDDPAKGFQFHTRVRGTVGSPGDKDFRGHGSGFDEAKTDILRYLIKVNNGLHEILKEDRVPLVLAGVDYLLPLYREANTYPHLFEQGITGNPDGWSDDELHQQAWGVVEPHFRKAQEEAAAKYMDLAGTGLASSDIRTIVPAAYTGRIESLFVSSGGQQWGVFKEATHEVEVHGEAAEGDVDLLSLSAIQAFMNSGAVYVVRPDEVPGGGALAAVFRY